jgi:hypothetical protein
MLKKNALLSVFDLEEVPSLLVSGEYIATGTLKPQYDSRKQHPLVHY